jgi:nitrile hydratase accessory protein
MSEGRLRELARELGCEESGVFSAPWEARAFAIALGLSQAGLFTWDEFRACLIAEVGRSDRIRERDGTSAQGHYYDHFVRALEAVLSAKAILSAADIASELRKIQELPQAGARHDPDEQG